MEGLLDPRVIGALGLIVLLTIALVSVFVGLAHATIGLAWLAVLGAAEDRSGDLLRRPRIRRALAGFTGAVLVFFGLRVVADPG